MALILVAFRKMFPRRESSCRVDPLRGAARFVRANPHLLPHLGLRKPPGHTALTTLLHRLDPEQLQEALPKVAPSGLTSALRFLGPYAA